MLTPATSASSTSSPATIRLKASSTQVRGPPFLYWWPFAEAITTGGVARRACTAGASARATPAAVETTVAAAPAFTKSRRVIFSVMALLVG